MWVSVARAAFNLLFFILQRREAQEDKALPGVLSLVVGHGSRKAIGYLD